MTCGGVDVLVNGSRGVVKGFVTKNNTDEMRHCRVVDFDKFERDEKSTMMMAWEVDDDDTARERANAFERERAFVRIPVVAFDNGQTVALVGAPQVTKKNSPFLPKK